MTQIYEKKVHNFRSRRESTANTCMLFGVWYLVNYTDLLGFARYTY